MIISLASFPHITACNGHCASWSVFNFSFWKVNNNNNEVQGCIQQGRVLILVGSCQHVGHV